MKDKPLTDEELDNLLIEYMPKANILLEQLEEEKYKNMPPHIFSKRHRRNIKKIIKEYSRTPLQKKFVDLRKYVAVILITIVILNSALIITVEAYRERFFDIITNVYEKFTSVVIEVDEGIIADELDFIKLSYIPEGFEVVNDMQNDMTRKIDYSNGDKIIVFMQGIITSTVTRIDTEGTMSQEIEINNHKIIYSLNKDIYNAYWTDDKFTYLITAEVSFEELIKIIEGIQK